MKVRLLGISLALLAAACTQTLEQAADSNRQLRIDRANANHPLTSGASDGLGGYIAEKYDENTTVPAKAKP
ncbi:MAG TPA: hypothetical protein VHM90_06555 [Phycisphaerae bacterium]|jgi:hypothetical protein|nr:hypothetical protein [Phycisphaerae bacterium]